MKKQVVTVTAILAFITFLIPSIGALAGSYLTSASAADSASPIAHETAAAFAPTTSPVSAAALAVPSPVEVLTLKITAYTSLPDETDSTPFITANGTYVHDGIVATNILPFGTKIEIPALFGNKIFTVEDRMNPVFNDNIDIWMPTKSAALFFGAHPNVTVLVLSGGDTEISEK